VRARGFTLLIALSAPPLYAAYVYGYKLTEFLSASTRIEGGLPWQAWGQVAVVGLQTVVIAAGLAVAWQMASAKRWRVVAIALGIAWLASAPLYVMLLAAPAI
jgi:hypothetical protein